MSDCPLNFPVFQAFCPEAPRGKHDPEGATGRWTDCPNLKTVYEGWESETRACDKCDRRFTLYDDDMR